MDISNTKNLNNKFIFWRHDNKPILFLLVGISGSGKSTIAQKIYAEDENGNVEKPVIHSSDALRLELFGSIDDQQHKEVVFKELHKRIKEDLRNGKNVIYDATNISKKIRVAFLSELKKLPVYKQCICVMTPYTVCLQFNKEKENPVPEYVIKKMYTTWTPPARHEGFDAVLPVYNYGNVEKRKEYTLKHLFQKMDPFDQENSHHEYTLGLHCREAAKYIIERYPEDRVLKAAAMLHDNGKVFTKTNKNAHGEIDGEYHYYQHHCVGAYDSMFYTEMMGMNYEDRFKIANLIYYHMHPNLSWKQSSRAWKKDLKLIGENMYDSILKLHEADEYAHGRNVKEMKKEEKEEQEIGGPNIER